MKNLITTNSPPTKPPIFDTLLHEYYLQSIFEIQASIVYRFIDATIGYIFSMIPSYFEMKNLPGGALFGPLCSKGLWYYVRVNLISEVLQCSA